MCIANYAVDKIQLIQILYNALLAYYTENISKYILLLRIRQQ